MVKQSMNNYTYFMYYKNLLSLETWKASLNSIAVPIDDSISKKKKMTLTVKIHKNNVPEFLKCCAPD